MSLALFSIAEQALSEASRGSARSKTPGKRQTIAVADRAAVPEPR